MNLSQIYLTGFNSFCMIAAVKRLQRQVANNHWWLIIVSICIIILHLYLSAPRMVPKLI